MTYVQFLSEKSLPFVCELQTLAILRCTLMSRLNSMLLTVTTSPHCGTTNCMVQFMWKRTRCLVTLLQVLKQGLSRVKRSLLHIQRWWRPLLAGVMCTLWVIIRGIFVQKCRLFYFISYVKKHIVLRKIFVILS